MVFFCKFSLLGRGSDLSLLTTHQKLHFGDYTAGNKVSILDILFFVMLDTSLVVIAF